MKTTLLFLSALLALSMSYPEGKPDKAPFQVTTLNVEVREMTSSSIRFLSEHNAYFIKLEPSQEGNVAFSLSGFVYSATERVTNLAFQVKITGYKGEEVIYPVFGLAGVNDEVVARDNYIRFQWLEGSVPVWFNQPVDSINLEYSNSHSMDVQQYLRLHDLRIIRDLEVEQNPHFTPCGDKNIMIAIDGSSSIEKKERKKMGKEFVKFVKGSSSTPDTNTFAILEYGTGVVASISSTDSKELIQAIANYKKGKNQGKAVSDWSNWSVAFDEAILERPELFIFITDGWSNWDGGEASSFTSVFSDLVEKSNLIKENGTRILFITADMNSADGSTNILHNFLGKENTRVEDEKSLASGCDLTRVDLIHLESLASMGQVPLHSLISCSAVKPAIAAEVEGDTE